MSRNITSNKITLFFLIKTPKNGSYALRFSFFKGHMAYKMVSMKVALLAFKDLLAHGKWSWCA